MLEQQIQIERQTQVRLKLTDSVASFHLNSSLVPGSHFTCHVELILDSSKFGKRMCCGRGELELMILVSGFFVYFDSMKISPPLDGVSLIIILKLVSQLRMLNNLLRTGECEMDYVQFGRDILFITSHRSNK